MFSSPFCNAEIIAVANNKNKISSVFSLVTITYILLAINETEILKIQVRAQTFSVVYYKYS